MARILRTFDFQNKQSVNINITRPFGYLYSEAFREAAEAIAKDAWDAGIDYIISENFNSNDKHNIILGAHLGCLAEKTKTEDYTGATIVNLERLHCFKDAWGEKVYAKYCALLKKNRVVDYCQTNDKYLKQELGKETDFLFRPWHDQRWTKVPVQVNKEYDVCFIGSITPRRKRIIDELKKRGLKVFTSKGAFSTERDQVLAKAKVILNIHAYDNSMEIELWRINYLASNGLYILSENSNFEAGEHMIAQRLPQESFDKLAERTEELIHAYDQEKARQEGVSLLEAATKVQSDGRNKQLENQEKSRILEKLHLNIGCGQTYYKDALNIDTDENSRAELVVDIDRPWEELRGLHILKDGTKALLHESQFDVIDANKSLQTVQDLAMALSNIARLLKPGGVLYFESQYQNSSNCWANPKTKREINEELIAYLNQWSKYTGLGDAKLVPGFIRITEIETSRSLIAHNQSKNIEACLVKKIDAQGPDGDAYHNFHQSNLGTLRLTDRIHRKLFVHAGAVPLQELDSNFRPNVSIITPTMGTRFSTLPLLWEWILRQNYPHERIEWIIGTDTDQEKEYLQKQLENGMNFGINIKIRSTHEKLGIGAKRNACNRWADGEIIVNMDDDDYYFPDRISHSVEKLKKSELCASQQLPIYFLDDESMWISDPGKGIGCAGSFAFRKALLSKTWYSEEAINGEEISFTDFYSMKIEALDPFKTMICIAHKNNTFDKQQLREKKAEQTFRLNSGRAYVGNDSFFKVEMPELTQKSERSDWQSWYRACLMEAGNTAANLEIPKLFSKNESNRLGRFTESILKRIDI